jgi:hypothetical protein
MRPAGYEVTRSHRDLAFFAKRTAGRDRPISRRADTGGERKLPLRRRRFRRRWGVYGGSEREWPLACPRGGGSRGVGRARDREWREGAREGEDSTSAEGNERTCG